MGNMQPPPRTDDQDWLDRTTAWIKKRPFVWIPVLLAIVLAVILVTNPFAASAPIGTGPTVRGRPLSNPDQHLHTLAIDPRTPGRVYLGSHFGLFVSNDNGKSWPQAQGALNTLMITSLAANPLAAGDLGLIGVDPSGSDYGQNGIYFSHDAGTTWQRGHDPEGLPADPVRYLIAPGTASPNQWYVIYNGLGLYVTGDNGQTWRLLRAPASSQVAQRVVWASSSDPQRILLGSNQGLEFTTDGGQAWQAVTAVAGGVHAVVSSPSAPHTIIVAADSGTYRSVDDGATFTRMSIVVSTGPFANLAISPHHAQVIYGQVGHEIWQSKDGGADWTQQQSLATTSPCPYLFVANDSDAHLYAGSYSPPVAVESHDGGQTWQIIAS